MIRKNDENYLEYAQRLTQALSWGSIGYKEWSKSLIGDVIYSEETLRRCSIFLEKFLDKVKNENLNVSDYNILNDFYELKEELEKEKRKIKQEKNELNQLYRDKARNEIFKDRIIEAIDNLPSFEINTVKNLYYEKEIGRSALLCLSDFHAGSEYEIKGLYNEIVNKYNFEIMQARMISIISQINKDNIMFDDMTVVILGDCFENILRLSSLTKIKEPVVDTVIKFSEFLSNWLVELSKIVHVPINVVTVGGNHDINRLLGGKPQLEEENLTKIVAEFLKLRLKDFKNITVDDYTDVAIKTIRKNNIMFQHGEDKDIEVTMNYFENLYNITVDAIICGHLHRPESKSVGITDVGDKTILRVGSICGVDPYAKKVRCAARPSCYFALYDEDNGKTWSRNYYL